MEPAGRDEDDRVLQSGRDRAARAADRLLRRGRRHLELGTTKIADSSDTTCNYTVVGGHLVGDGPGCFAAKSRDLPAADVAAMRYMVLGRTTIHTHGRPGGMLRLRVKPSGAKLRAQLRHRVRVHGEQVYLRALIVITIKPRHGHARKVTQQLLLPV